MLDKIDSSSLPKRKVLGELGVPKSTYYRWLRRKEQQGLDNDAGGENLPWNKLTSQEVGHVLSAARGDAGVEFQTAVSMDHRQHGILCIRVYGLLHPAQGGAGEEA